MTGIIDQISVSSGGVPKLAVDAAEVTVSGMEGDSQRDLRHHGGPDRALCLYSGDVIATLRSEGHPIRAGSAGENVTVSGVEWHRIVPGVRLRLGSQVEVEITSFTAPCAHNKQWFVGGNIMRMSQKLHPGSSRVYARVLKEGRLEPGYGVQVV